MPTNISLFETFTCMFDVIKLALGFKGFVCFKHVDLKPGYHRPMSACLFRTVPTPMPECHKCIPKHGNIHPPPSANLLQCYLEFILSGHNAHLWEEVGHKKKLSQPAPLQRELEGEGVRGWGYFKANHQNNTSR